MRSTIDVPRARQILGSDADNMSDEELGTFLLHLQGLADLTVRKHRVLKEGRTKEVLVV